MMVCPIDASLWNEAHLYHQQARQLAARMLHGWGIVVGLDVVPTDPPSRVVLVKPGLALDRLGRLLHLARERRLNVTKSGAAPVRFVLRFADRAGAQEGRLVDDCTLLESTDLPSLHDVEVGRALLGDAAMPIRMAADPERPARGEIDALARRMVPAAPHKTLVIGQLARSTGGDAPPHQVGLSNMVKAMSTNASFVVQYAGLVPLEQASTCDLLYVSGAGDPRLSPRDGAQLRAFLRQGGLLLAEPCAALEEKSGQQGQFVASWSRLLTELSYPPADVAFGHTLYMTPHVFGQAPPGTAGDAPLRSFQNVILTTNDYGCCWQGGRADAPLSREVIRGALELGENVLRYGVDRTWQRDAAIATSMGSAPHAEPGQGHGRHGGARHAESRGDA